MTISKHEGAERGEQLRDKGIERAVTGRELQVMTDELAFLDALAKSPDGTATSDDAVADLSKKFRDGGKWRGSTPLRLARKGLIRDAGYVRSCRPSRHRTKITVWAIADRDRLLLRRDELRQKLTEIEAASKTTGPETAISEPVESQNTSTTDGVNEHGKAS